MLHNSTCHGDMPLLVDLEQVQAGRLDKGFLAAMGVQFPVETTDLRLDRVGRNDQFGSHLWSGVARCQQVQDSPLTRT